MPQEPPPGWATLREKARQTKDPKELAGIIDEMNKLLAGLEDCEGDHTRKPQSKPEQRATASPVNKKKRR